MFKKIIGGLFSICTLAVLGVPGCGDDPAAPSETTAVSFAAAATGSAGPRVHSQMRRSSGLTTASNQGSAEVLYPTHAYRTTSGGLPTPTSEFQHEPFVIPVFWGSNVDSNTTSKIQPALMAMWASSWALALTSEYGPSAGFFPLAPITITPQSTGACSISQPCTVSDAQIQTELNWQMTNGINGAFPALPSDRDYIFIVHFPPTVTPVPNAHGIVGAPCGPGGWLGYHYPLASRHFGYQLTYIVIPDYSKDSVCDKATPFFAIDQITITESHEIAETVTDPDGTSGYRVRNPKAKGYYDANGKVAKLEIGDLCEQNEALTVYPGNGVPGSVVVQPIWSNRANLCVTSPGAVSDTNRDGRSDLMLTGGGSGGPWSTMPVAHSTGFTYWGTNSGVTSGDTNFPSYAHQAHVRPVAGDFDGNGLTDIALIGGGDGGIWSTIPVANTFDFSVTATNLGLTAGDTQFFTYANWGGANQGTIPVSGDFDGDGLTDIALIITGQNLGFIPIAFSNGNGTFRVVNETVTSGDTNFTLYASQWGARPISGDFNGDGLADIALVGGTGWNTMPVAFSMPNSSAGGITFYGTNRGEVTGDTSFASKAAIHGGLTVAGDFNGDGLSDLALVGTTAGALNWKTIPVAFSLGNGTYQGSNLGITNGDVSFMAGASAPGAKPVAGDFNGDGLSDIALVGGVGMTTMPIAFPNTAQLGSFQALNGGEVSGDLGFAGYATQTGAQPVTW